MDELKSELLSLHHGLTIKLKGLAPGGKKWIEQSFHMAMLCWEDVKKKITGGFCCPAKEIEFFKKTKHLFTAEMEYYSLRYHAVIFEPAERERKIYFWEREAQRFPLLNSKHQLFYDYYVNGKTDQDVLFFIRGDNYPLSNGLPQIAEEEKAFATPYDLLITQYLAAKRYHKFAEGRLRQFHN